MFLQGNHLTQRDSPQKQLIFGVLRHVDEVSARMKTQNMISTSTEIASLVKLKPLNQTATVQIYLR